MTARSDEPSGTGDEVAAAVEAVSEPFERLGRAGWIAKGVVYALVGVLFIRIALGTAQSDEANQTGAVEQVAASTAGALLVGALAVGLGLFLLWRAFTVVLPGDWTGRALLDRIGYAISTVAYSSLLITTIGILRQRDTSADEREDRRIEALVDDVLDLTAGRLLVAAAGLGIVALGSGFAHKGWSRGFRSDISGAGGVEDTVIERLGTIGWLARGASMALIGVFLIRAAWVHDPDEAAGLDDSIRQIADNPAGAVLAAVVGLGFTAFGLFAIVSARHRDLEGPTNR